MSDASDRNSESKHSGFLSAEQLLAAIVDSSDDAIISKDLNGVITSWNLGAERIFGYEAAEIVGHPVLRLLPPDRYEEEVRILDHLKAGQRIEHFETIRVRKDGCPVEVSLTISPVRNSAGVIVGASKIARNITEQKRAMRRLAEANEALARADRMKIEFISTLSHELRTPLTAVVGWLQILKEGATPAEVQEGVEVIERNIRAQAQLINDLLDMSRIEAGKMVLDVQRLDLPATVAAAIDTVRPAAAAKEVRLSSAFSSINGTVMGDKSRLQQVVWNLLTNAVKFTPKHGRVHVTIERHNSHVEINVTDTGPGITPEYLGHIFERFSQADSSTTRRHGGLGLGLSIAKHLTELHGGTVSASSGGLGLGATFRISLPLLAVHHEPDRSSSGHRAGDAAIFSKDDLKGVHVLLVEDEPDSAEVIRRILTRSGAHVQIAGTMDTALAAFDRAAPDVLLSDIGLPEHDGYELITRVRTRPLGQKVPAVALTALARSEDRARALHAGFQMHVAKPVDSAELIAVVRNLANLRADPAG